MLDQEFYPIDEAAKIIGCTEEYLIRLGTVDQLDICMQPISGFKAFKLNKDMEKIEQNSAIISEICTIPISSLCEYLVNNRGYIKTIKSYDEPNVYYEPDGFWGFDEITLVVIDADIQRLKANDTAQNTAIDIDISETQKKAEQQNPISKDLATLNKASSLYWLNADPSDRDTHPTNDNVSDWLKLQGFSEISAKQGASIIRPEWAAKGRR